MRGIQTSLAVLGFVTLAAAPALAQGGTVNYAPLGNFKPSLDLDDEVEDAIQQAEAAIKACDEGSYEDAIDWLDEIADDVGGDTGEDIDDVIDGLDSKWNSTFPCGLRPRENPYAINFHGIIGRLVLMNSPGYLGKENGGVINTLRFVRPDNSGTFYGGGAEFRYSMGGAPNWPNWANIGNLGRKRTGLWDFFAGLNRSRARFDDNFTNIETGGDALLLPGVGSGPNGAGFNLAFGGGLNTVTSANYDAEYDFDRYYLGLGKSVSLNGVKVRSFGGLEYGRMDVSQTFGGAIPGFARDFEYHTSVKNDIYSPYIGVESSYKPSWTSFPLSAELYGKATYKLNYNRADGRDSLAFTGFDTQTIDLDERQFTHNFALETGITFNPDKAFSYSIGGGYQRMGNMPTVTRDGVGPSNLNFEDSNVWTAGIRATFRY